MKLLFWAFVVVDALVLGLFGLLALAAAGSSRTHPLAALLIPCLLPAALLVGAIWLFQSAQSSGPKLLAIAIAALPWIVLLVQRGAVLRELQAFRDGSGQLREFRSEALRTLEAAIVAHDAAAVAQAARGVDLDEVGLSGVTVLVLALRELQRAPGQLDVVKALLDAGADPNAGRSELPLQGAIAASRHSGIEPLRLLLAAGADPNGQSEFGDPAFFLAGGATYDVAVMEQLLAHGARLDLRGSQGASAVLVPTTTRNWPVLLLLLERGAPWRDQRGPGGVPWRAYVEQELRHDPSPAAAAVADWLRKQA